MHNASRKPYSLSIDARYASLVKEHRIEIPSVTLMLEDLQNKGFLIQSRASDPAGCRRRSFVGRQKVCLLAAFFFWGGGKSRRSPLFQTLCDPLHATPPLHHRSHHTTNTPSYTTPIVHCAFPLRPRRQHVAHLSRTHRTTNTPPYITPIESAVLFLCDCGTFTTRSGNVWRI